MTLEGKQSLRDFGECDVSVMVPGAEIKFSPRLRSIHLKESDYRRNFFDPSSLIAKTAEEVPHAATI